MRLNVLTQEDYRTFTRTGEDRARGVLLVDKEGYVRWISDEVLLHSYEGVGEYSGADGYQTYERKNDA